MRTRKAGQAQLTTRSAFILRAMKRVVPRATAVRPMAACWR
jgi:hypothetical protein